MIPAYNIDLLKIYFGDPYPITDKLIIYQPSIQQIIDYGEAEFFSMVNVFIGNTTSRRLDLWDMGIDWNQVCDYELFCNLVRMFPQEKTEILFGGVDFSKFELKKVVLEMPEELETPLPEGTKLTASQKRQRKFAEFENNITFYNEDQDIEIPAILYHHFVSVLREIFQIFPKTEYTVGKISKEIIIEEERQKLVKLEKENKGKPQSNLQPMISMCVNHPGFKYKTSELKEIKINEFMDSVMRLQVYESTHALYSGMYSGFCDTSKIPKDQFDFSRSISEKK